MSDVTEELLVDLGQTFYGFHTHIDEVPGMKFTRKMVAAHLNLDEIGLKARAMEAARSKEKKDVQRTFAMRSASAELRQTSLYAAAVDSIGSAGRRLQALPKLLPALLTLRSTSAAAPTSTSGSDSAPVPTNAAAVQSSAAAGLPTTQGRSPLVRSPTPVSTIVAPATPGQFVAPPPVINVPVDITPVPSRRHLVISPPPTRVRTLTRLGLRARDGVLDSPRRRVIKPVALGPVIPGPWLAWENTSRK